MLEGDEARVETQDIENRFRRLCDAQITKAEHPTTRSDAVESLLRCELLNEIFDQLVEDIQVLRANRRYLFLVTRELLKMINWSANLCPLSPWSPELDAVSEVTSLRVAFNLGDRNPFPIRRRKCRTATLLRGIALFDHKFQQLALFFISAFKPRREPRVIVSLFLELQSKRDSSGGR